MGAAGRERRLWAWLGPLAGDSPSGPSQQPLTWLHGVDVRRLGEFFCHLKLHSGTSCPVPNGVGSAMPGWGLVGGEHRPYLVCQGRQPYPQGIASLIAETQCCLWEITSLIRESQLWIGKDLNLMGETQFLSEENP